MTALPLGEEESEMLAFQSREALGRAWEIVHDAVAMLNARGGDVWVGIRALRRRAVAGEDVQNPDSARAALRDVLMDTIEPAPREGEVKVEVVADDVGGSALRIWVQPEDRRRPYARISGSARHFVIRDGDRVRPMTREEILSPGAKASAVSCRATGRVSRRLQAARESARKRGGPTFLMSILPDTEDLAIDLQDTHLRSWLQDAAASGNRPEGWVFANRYATPVLKSESLVQEAEVRTEIGADGSVVCCAPLDVLRHGPDEQEIWPLALAELPVSLLRLASRLYAHAGGQGAGGQPRVFPVTSDLALFEVHDWRLHPYSPGSLGFMIADDAQGFREDDLVRSRPFVFSSEEIIQHPDRCGFRMLRWIYQDFGHDDSKIPREFDRDSGVLTIGR